MTKCIDPMSIIIWIVVAFTLVVLIVVVTTVTTNECFKEFFGSDCMDFIPFNRTPEHELQPNKIFVSIASYRDDECKQTLKTMFENAKHPENIIAGLCQQNKEGEQEEECVKSKQLMKKWGHNIRQHNMTHLDAKGPTYARYWCSQLWKGEQYFLQIDSHTYFQPNWDEDVINMHKQCLEESSKPVLTVYPPTDDQVKMEGSPEMCNGKITGSGKEKIPVFLAGWTSKSDRPKRCPKPFTAAGFMFLEGNFLYDVPFDPNFAQLFQGEETVFSARLWTNGYDFYTPNKNVCHHTYYRKEKPKYWDEDRKNHADCRKKAERRCLFLLNLLPESSVTAEYLRDTHQYGMGKFRRLDDYWLVAGIDFDKDGKEGIEDWCNDNDTKTDKFKGWNFKKHGYKKIKKFS